MAADVTVLDSEVRDGVVLADHLLSFVAKGEMYSPRAIETAVAILQKDRDKLEPDERELIASAIKFLQQQRR